MGIDTDKLRDKVNYQHGFIVFEKDTPIFVVEWNLQGVVHVDNLINRRHFSITPGLYKEKVVFPDVVDFLETRVVPKNRIGLDELLRRNGFKEYDPMGIATITKGVRFEDFTWVRFDGDEGLRFDDVKLR